MAHAHKILRGHPPTNNTNRLFVTASLASVVFQRSPFITVDARHPFLCCTRLVRLPGHWGMAAALMVCDEQKEATATGHSSS